MRLRQLLGWVFPLGVSWLFGILKGRRKVVISADQVCGKVLRLKSALWEIETYLDLHIYYCAFMRPRKLEARCACSWQVWG